MLLMTKLMYKVEWDRGVVLFTAYSMSKIPVSRLSIEYEGRNDLHRAIEHGKKMLADKYNISVDDLVQLCLS